MTDIVSLKSFGTTLALGLAVLNLLTMSQLMGWIKLFRLPSRPLKLWHKRQGGVVLVGFLIIAYHCLTVVPNAVFTPRVIAHAIFGGIGLALILSKFCIVHLFPRLGRVLPTLGASLFVATVGIFLTSALVFLLSLVGLAERPEY
ncbi:MAG: hypothetical protein HYY85_15740 [Deltaproteobacteria bacterium]|nr:hypothetical protein [Deltaproteobacteria bacterium]